MAEHKPKGGDHDRHRYEEHRQETPPVGGREYGRVRAGETDNTVIGGGESHSYGGYGSDYVRSREEFGGGGPPLHEPSDAYQPGYEVKKGSGYGALGQGGQIDRPGEGMPDPDPQAQPVEKGRSGGLPDEKPTQKR
ncbi:hypothetical protein SLNSH_04110 [Alsobacter soli]|uniref:Uncharacterized protein n=1 Tax=Alsobacter soli TaxID=2109933 RepID=A0A2T1HXS2_9HYPH|nr:hypothetical protein [Alsobacter soli]PSC06471.1 hypothetical protein SLNSH_04110 [Alsobacter soli]